MEGKNKRKRTSNDVNEIWIQHPSMSWHVRPNMQRMLCNLKVMLRGIAPDLESAVSASSALTFGSQDISSDDRRLDVAIPIALQ